MGIVRCRRLGVRGTHRGDVEDFGYGLFAGGLKPASFAEGRMGFREWAHRNGRVEEIHSIGDHYDDVDELMA